MVDAPVEGRFAGVVDGRVDGEAPVDGRFDGVVEGRAPPDAPPVDCRLVGLFPLL